VFSAVGLVITQERNIFGFQCRKAAAKRKGAMDIFP
jgi:hypothetical protein